MVLISEHKLRQSRLLASKFAQSLGRVGFAGMVCALAACAGHEADPSQKRDAAEPSRSAPRGAKSQLSERIGVRAYDGYQTAVAQEGDTVATLAQRVGLSSDRLAAYNGLEPSFELRAGDELVIPPG